MLVSLPFVPAVAGVGSSAVRYSYQTAFTRDITGPFLRTPQGTIKLFAWRDPQDPYPADALRVHAADVSSLLVRAAAVDRPEAYRLFDIGRGIQVPLVVRRAGPTALTLAPARPLPPGRYAFVPTHEGMFGGKDFTYVEVVPPGAPTTTVYARDVRVPAVADALPPLAATLVALLFGLLLLRSFLQRPAGQKALWAAGFLLFAAAAGCETAAQRTGWTPGLFRAYYLTGGVLTVALLGSGSAWLLLPRRARDVLVGALGVGGLVAVLAIAFAPVDAAALARAVAERPPPNLAIGGHASWFAIAFNSFGSLFLIGGSLLSIAAAAARLGEPLDRRRRLRGGDGDRPVAGRHVRVRLPGTATRDRADVLRLPVRGPGAQARAGAGAGCPGRGGGPVVSPAALERNAAAVAADALRRTRGLRQLDAAGRARVEAAARGVALEVLTALAETARAEPAVAAALAEMTAG